MHIGIAIKTNHLECQMTNKGVSAIAAGLDDGKRHPITEDAWRRIAELKFNIKSVESLWGKIPKKYKKYFNYEN